LYNLKGQVDNPSTEFCSINQFIRDAHLLTICRAKLRSEGTLWWFSACMLVMACVVVTVCAGATSTLQKLEVLSVHVHIKSVHRIKMISVDSRYSKRKLIDIYVAFLVRSLTSFIVIFWHHPWFIFTEIYLLKKPSLIYLHGDIFIKKTTMDSSILGAVRPRLAF